MNENKTQGNKERPEIPPGNLPVIAQECDVNEPQAKKSTDTPGRKKSITKGLLELPIEKVTLLFSGLLVLFTSVYAIVSIFQWNALRKQTEVLNKQSEIMSKQLFAGQRAWVTVKGANYSELKAGEKASAVVIFINSGSTPALNATLNGNMGFSEPPIPVPMPFVNSREREPSAVVIGPHNEMNTFLATDNTLTKEIINSASEKRMRLYVWGVTEYDDIFGKRHKTEFCLVNRLGTRNFDACSNNNTVD